MAAATLGPVCPGRVTSALWRWWRDGGDGSVPWESVTPVALRVRPVGPSSILDLSESTTARALVYHHGGSGDGTLTVYGSLPAGRAGVGQVPRLHEVRSGPLGDGTGDSWHYARCALFNVRRELFHDFPHRLANGGRLAAPFCFSDRHDRDGEAYGAMCSILAAVVHPEARARVARAEAAIGTLLLRRHCPSSLTMVIVGEHQMNAARSGDDPASISTVIAAMRPPEWPRAGTMMLLGKAAHAYSWRDGVFWDATVVDGPPPATRRAPPPVAAALGSAASRHVHRRGPPHPDVMFAVDCCDAFAAGPTRGPCATCGGSAKPCPRARPVVHRGRALLAYEDVLEISAPALEASIVSAASLAEHTADAACFAAMEELRTAPAATALDAYVGARTVARSKRKRASQSSAAMAIDGDVRRRAMPRHEAATERWSEIRETLKLLIGARCRAVIEDMRAPVPPRARPRGSVARSGTGFSAALVGADGDLLALRDMVPPCMRVVLQRVASGAHPNYWQRCLLGSFLLAQDAFEPLVDGESGASPDAEQLFRETWQRLFPDHAANFAQTKYCAEIKSVIKEARRGRHYSCQYAVNNGLCPFVLGDAEQFCRETSDAPSPALTKLIADPPPLPPLPLPPLPLPPPTTAATDNKEPPPELLGCSCKCTLHLELSCGVHLGRTVRTPIAYANAAARATTPRIVENKPST